MRLFLTFIVFIPVLLFAQGQVEYDQSSPLLEFGASRIREAIEHIRTINGHGKIPNVRLVLERNAEGLISGGYRISDRENTLVVTAVDEAGAMYGALELAEQLRMSKGMLRVKSHQVNPQFTVRALKVNLPWSSYRTGPAMQQHMRACRDLRFWESFLDQMAENRFNILSLWNVHPFLYGETHKLSARE